MAKTVGDNDADQFAISTTLQYINEEMAYVSKNYPEKASFVMPSTSSGYYHTLDFTGFPVVAVDNLMVNGVGAEKRPWKVLRGRIGNAI